MEKNSIFTTEEEYLKDGREVAKIDALDLAQQIHPLLNDFFCGSFAVDSNGILMKMENGQVFQLTVTEVA